MNADPLRILHALAPAPYGGLERVVSQLAAGTAARGHAVQVVATLSPDDPMPPFLEELAAAGVGVTALRVSPRSYRAEARQLRALCTEVRAQVVHSHGHRSDWVAGGVARRLCLPHLATVHGFIRTGWKSRIAEWLQLRALRRCHGVVAVSAPLAETLVAAGIAAARIHRLPNAWAGRSAPLSREQARRSLALPAAAPVVGFVGRLGREKGADVLIDALARLGAGGDAPQVCLVGDGPEAQALRHRAARGGVVLHEAGALAGAERVFAAFDVFVLSSRSEGTPMVLFEAMAAGVPIVATRVGGVPDVVGEAEACLVAPEDPGALAAAIRDTLADPAAAAARAARARQRLEEAHGATPWLERYEALYRALLTGSGSSASAASLTVAGRTDAKRETPST